MFLPNRFRFRRLIHDFVLDLDDMALTEILPPPLPNESLLSSTASTPSLRASTPAMSSDTDAGNVKVVVRVRKFVPREIQQQSPCLVEMDPETQRTILHPPLQTDDAASSKMSRRNQEERNFTFDKSFWSHDESSPHYSTQQHVFDSFGEDFLDHNFDGYHTCIFAYGQTGAGKSYTMMGTPEEPGLTPRTCEALFQRIQSEQNSAITYNVHVSYFEVYNEHVRDLLVPRTNPPVYLKIRESKADGVYVQNLTDAPVKSYADVARLMESGDKNRTTASTKMNDTSSRSHAVFTLTLRQIQHDIETDSTIERTARMRLVDLAGSERAGRTEATGARLREGGNINQSLTTLGRVIAALADPRRQQQQQQQSRIAQPNGGRQRRGGEVVPYRDSVLTWLLKDSLGGNSKTAMVACISPSDYDETLSTLRYADQAKRIRTRAHVNQDAVSAAERDAQISRMAETIRLLQQSVTAGAARKRDEADRATHELEDYQRQVDKMQRAMEESRAVSDVKIRALTAELEELRPVNERLATEVASLRRHLALALGELKNPIVLPGKRGGGEGEICVYEDELGSEGGSEEEGTIDEGADDGRAEYGPSTENFADWQADVDDLIKDLGLFKRKVASDRSRFSRWGAVRGEKREGEEGEAEGEDHVDDRQGSPEQERLQPLSEVVAN